jgi:ribonuclease P protein component
MPIGRIRTRSTFSALRQHGRRARSGALRVTHVPDPLSDEVRVAYAIPRTVGTAVVRNRLRRRLRAACAELAPPSGAYLVSVSTGAAACTYAELRADLGAAFTALARADREGQP